MIAYIEGRLLAATVTTAVIATDSGLGYEVFMPGHSLSHLPEKNGRVAVYTSFVVREDAQELFGFDTWDERQTFDVLRSLNKVGPRTALGILTVFRPDDLRRLVLDDDPTPLTRVSGIGKKTAQTAFLELKFKLKANGVSLSGAGAAVAGSVYKDVLEGLQGLGYSEDEAAPVIRGILHTEPDLDVSGALRAALRGLAKANTSGRGDS